ncbi:putative conjugative transfer protein TraN [Orientia tsutsugamushi str. UT76]|nr:putative conjugative transfer protein TraN [Orientia tsutsugamushi str. UT76]
MANRQIEFAKKEIVRIIAIGLRVVAMSMMNQVRKYTAWQMIPKPIERQMKWAIVNRLGVPTQHIGRNFYYMKKMKYVYLNMTTEIRLKN